MSTLAITAAHFVTIPVRYAVGRWYNIPTNTLLAFNAADIGLHILVTSIWNDNAAKKNGESVPLLSEAVSFFFATKVVTCLAAVYLTLNFTEPMSLKAAALTCLASSVVIAGVILYMLIPALIICLLIAAIFCGKG